MKIEGLSDKVATVVNQVANVGWSLGFAVYFYDGVADVALATLVMFAFMNLCDAVFAWTLIKFKKGEE